MTDQMAAGRVRPMHPILALQAFIGPIFFHLLSRPVIEQLTPVPSSVQEAIDELVAVSVVGLEP